MLCHYNLQQTKPFKDFAPKKSNLLVKLYPMPLLILTLGAHPPWLGYRLNFSQEGPFHSMDPLKLWVTPAPRPTMAEASPLQQQSRERSSHGLSQRLAPSLSAMSVSTDAHFIQFPLAAPCLSMAGGAVW